MLGTSRTVYETTVYSIPREWHHSKRAVNDPDFEFGDDIFSAQKYAQGKGYEFNIASMNGATLSQISKSKSVKCFSQINSFVGMPELSFGIKERFVREVFRLPVIDINENLVTGTVELLSTNMPLHQLRYCIRLRESNELNAE